MYLKELLKEFAVRRGQGHTTLMLGNIRPGDSIVARDATHKGNIEEQIKAYGTKDITVFTLEHSEQLKSSEGAIHIDHWTLQKIMDDFHRIVDERDDAVKNANHRADRAWSRYDNLKNNMRDLIGDD